MDNRNHIIRDLTWENPFASYGLTDDEAAIARLLSRMKTYIETGEEAYPLREALQDAYFAILMDRALLHPYELIQSESQMWS